jgi:phosphatidylserine/phosphatidylglycerophosphate/cardiolipin synthase-like enzyme
MSKEINTIVGDIYIGKGAGKLILEDMLKAKRSIRVMSPYLSAGLVDILLERLRFGVHIELVTSDDIEDHQHADKNCYQIIKQHKHVDEELKNKKQFFHWLGIGLMIVFGFFAVVKLPGVLSSSIEASDMIQFSLFAVLALIGRFTWKHADGINFRYYSYSSLFPIKIFYSYFSRKKHDRSKAFNLHSKLYIIDDRIAYLGSVNFTRSGCSFNHETRIRITDPEAIHQLKEEFSELLWNEYYNHRSVDEWGRELYEEMIN